MSHSGSRLRKREHYWEDRVELKNNETMGGESQLFKLGKTVNFNVFPNSGGTSPCISRLTNTERERRVIENRPGGLHSVIFLITSFY